MTARGLNGGEYSSIQSFSNELFFAVKNGQQLLAIFEGVAAVLTVCLLLWMNRKVATLINNILAVFGNDKVDELFGVIRYFRFFVEHQERA